MESITPGRVLNGKWTLGAPLGRGGSGMVYEAFHRNGIQAAVKILHPELAADEDRVARFLREGAIANHLEHVGAVVAFDDDRTEDGLVYVVFERLEGKPLSEILEERASLSPVEALRITDALLDVLVATHDHGVLHRDIKPANVFVLPDGAIKLLDFGLAKSDGRVPDWPSVVPTAQGAVLGTPGFMSPEQARGDAHLVDVRSDLWSVTAVLFTMLTRMRVTASSGVAPPPIRSVRSQVPDVVARIVDRGLSLDARDRFPTAARMQGAVRYALSILTDAPLAAAPAEAPSMPVPPEPRRPGRPARNSGSFVVLALLGVTAFAGVSWLAYASSQPEPRRPPDLSEIRR